MGGDGSKGCARFEEAISARMDGEDPVLDAEVIEAHLDGCQGCRGFAEFVGGQRRQGRLRVAENVPDLRSQILAALPVGPAPRPRLERGGRRVRRRFVIGAAFSVALVVVGLVVGNLMSGRGSGNGVTITQVVGSDETSSHYPGATVYPQAAVLPKPTV